MNQILITKKLYITPELKRKKKIYKFDFILSIFLVCALFSVYIYAEYDRNKSEEVSQEILADMNIGQDDTTINEEDNVLVVVLDEEEQNTPVEDDEKEETKVHKTKSGDTYSTIAVVDIPKIDVNYPVLNKTTDELLKISPTKFWGPEPNEVGNFCIVGHNYRNKRFFSKVPDLKTGDKINITDLSGRKITYKVYDKYTVEPTDVSCTSQLTQGRKEITLITCTDDSKHRVVVKAREVV